jgi:hypothetical protein
MRAVAFLLETLEHFAKEVEGPPPGVPVHADAEFETDLVALCRHQRLSSLVSETFDELALPPTISRITIARIKHDADTLERRRARRLRLAGRIAGGFANSGVRAALLGDVWSASREGAAGRVRPVDRIDAMVDETQWMEAVAVLRELGFVRTRIQPRLSDSSHALRYHQYFTPLVMHNHDGDPVELRFRVIDFGHPGRTNPAWDRTTEAAVGEATGQVVSREDQLIHSLISFGAEGFVDLLPVLDAGWLLHRAGGADSLDCAYVAGRLRDRGLYPAFYFTLEHVCGLINLPRVMERFDRPPGWRRHVFHMWWRPKEADYSGETEPTAGRFSYGLIESGGAFSKALWLRRALFPRSAWVRSVYGRPANLWLRLKFLHDVRSGRRRRPEEAAPTEAGGGVTDIDRPR